ncbi:MAG: hypothetical protein GC136_00375 [Alphaproteobacteria bacterium]|nr:hypothetical protein [Alphaproteobacteria bacterium]
MSISTETKNFNALPLQGVFRQVCYALDSGEGLNEAHQFDALSLIENLREKIAAFDWKSVAAGGDAAREVITSAAGDALFASLVAIADNTESGAAYISRTGAGPDSIKRYKSGASQPSWYLRQQFIVDLKQIIETELKLFEVAVQEQKPYAGFSRPISLRYFG